MAEEAAAKLLDFTQPMDVGLLDTTVAAFYSASNPQEVRMLCHVLLLLPAPTPVRGGLARAPQGPSHGDGICRQPPSAVLGSLAARCARGSALLSRASRRHGAHL